MAENEIIIPKFQPRTTQNSIPSHSTTETNSDVCPVCHGTGWELYKVSEIFLEDVYGDNTAACGDFAKRCSRCKGYSTKNEDRTGCPENMRDADITRFRFNAYKVDIPGIEKIARSIVDGFSLWQKRGKSLYIFSKTAGSGKTFLACCIGKSVMMKYGIRMKFITVPGYIDKVSERYSLNKAGIADDPTDIYRTCELLILDDIGTQLDKPWQNQELFKLINQRVSNGLMTIYTSNLTIENLNVDDRIKNRIYGTSIMIQMPEESMRIKRHVEEQDSFLREILG